MNKYLIISFCISTCMITYAKDTPNPIPQNLLFQAPEPSLAVNELAGLSGSRPTGHDIFDKTFGLKLGDIYISYINNKATLAETNDWNKSYPLAQGHYDIRFVAQFQTGFYKGNLSFNAQQQQQYQVLSERNKSVKGLQYFFWIANKNTGEVVSEKILFESIGASRSINYIPAVR